MQTVGVVGSFLGAFCGAVGGAVLGSAVGALAWAGMVAVLAFNSASALGGPEPLIHALAATGSPVRVFATVATGIGACIGMIGGAIAGFNYGRDKATRLVNAQADYAQKVGGLCAEADKIKRELDAQYGDKNANR